MKFKSDIEVQAGLKDSSGSNGSSGQVLSSDGTTVSWVNAGSSVASDVQNEVKAGVAINKGQAVYVTSADGTNIIVGLASNTSEATSSKTLGLLNATVAINGFADVVQIGKLSGLNTIGANAGDPVWLGVNGNLIYGLANKPYAPAHLVFIGIVTRVNANNGEIFITVQNGFELKEIHDVDLVTNVPINGDVLGYDGTLWVNKTIAEWLGYTPVPNTRALTINGNTQNLTADRTWTIDIGINGSGTVNTLSKFTGTTTIGDSQIKDSGTSVSIGYTTNPNTYKLDVNGDVNINTDLYVSGTFPYTIKAAGGVNVDDALGVYWKTDVGGIGGTLAGIGQSSSGLDFYTNSSFLAPKLRILANGNVTVGTLAGSGSRMVVADATGVLSTQAIPPSGVTSFNTRTGAVTLTSGDVTTALGYTPVTDARTITINGVTQDLAANRSWTVTAPETDTLQTVTGRGNTTTNGLIATASESREVSTYLPGSYTTNDLVSGTNYKWYSDIWRLGATRSSGASAADFVIQFNGSNRLNLSTAGSLTASGDMRAPVFYDSNNTAYYVDPASTSVLNGLTVSGYELVRARTQGNWASTGVIDNVVGLLAWKNYGNNHVIFDASNGTTPSGTACNTTNPQNNWSSSYPTLMGWNGANTYGVRVDSARYADTVGSVTFDSLTSKSGGTGTYQTSGDFRAPIFYDSNNTAYYLDPALSSSLKGLTVVDTIYGDITGTAGSLGGRAADRYIWGDGANGRSKSMTSGNANASDPSNSSGFYFGNSTTGMPSADWWNWLTVAGDSWSGSDGYRWQMAGSFWSNDWRLRRQTSGGWNGWVSLLHSGNYSEYSNFSGAVYGTIYYDSNDTAYYLNPASGSNLLSLTTKGSITNSGGHYSSYIQNELPAGNNGAATGLVTLRQWCSEPNVSWDAAGFGYNVYNDGGSPGGFGRPNTNFGQAYMRMISSGNWYFYTTNTSGTRYVNMELTPNGNVYFSGVTEAASSSRAPIFYDIADTGYYIDPGANSRISSIEVLGQIQGGSYIDCTNVTGGAYRIYNGTTFRGGFGTDTWASGGSSTDMVAYSVGNLFLFSNSLKNGRLDTSGNFTVSGDVTAYGSPSDIRLKTIKEKIPNALESVLKLNGYRFDWKNPDEILNIKEDIGVIAQEVEAVFPELARTNENGFMSVRHQGLTAVLIEAIKEQQTQIEELKELVNKLINK